MKLESYLKLNSDKCVFGKWKSRIYNFRRRIFITCLKTLDACLYTPVSKPVKKTVPRLTINNHPEIKMRLESYLKLNSDKCIFREWKSRIYNFRRHNFITCIKTFHACLYTPVSKPVKKYVPRLTNQQSSRDKNEIGVLSEVEF
jgi:hypothetical protein